ncbi:sporulation YhaL family protein [Aquibacillus rhizosphaerae]|uniref:Sporulation YhaL family protein n=1 Tax=Aquibacillus rhizosphaerae TaxID=3051431 RepID=A0ABT7LC27_9BACI|nr:sporulation YhaL family protein [Aquibacillus sp. LR5S19]MDL4842750.1 sporulation YhaL family protein [Aquibacillus sp. LR5S19]
MILGISWWVYLFILLIFFSGYMAFRAMVAERKLEKQFIESQGQVYLDRMEEERKSKKEITSG